MKANASYSVLAAPGYAAGIQPGWVYLPEALCHLRSPRP